MLIYTCMIRAIGSTVIPCSLISVQIGTVVIITWLVRAPPCREQVSGPTSALHRKWEDEHHDLSASVEGCITWLVKGPEWRSRILTSSDNVVVFSKPARVARTQPPLREECDSEVRKNGGIDSNTKPSDKVAVKNVSMLLVIQEKLNVRDNWSIKIIRAKFWPVPVDDPERNRDEKSN